MPHGINIRPTNQIDDPTWDDVQQRDALIRWLANIVAGQYERDGRPDTVLILDSVDEALTAIGDVSDAELDAAVKPLPTRRELRGEAVEREAWSDAPDGYTGTL